MTKKSNRITNIITVLMALLLLGIAAGPASATDMLVKETTANGTTIRINSSDNIGTGVFTNDAVNETYVNRVQSLNISIKLDTSVTNVNGTASPGQYNLTNISIDFTGSGITLPETYSANTINAYTGTLLAGLKDSNSGINTSKEANLSITSTSINITSNSSVSLQLALNNGADGAGNWSRLLFNLTNLVMPSTEGNKTITIYAWNHTQGIGTNVTKVYLGVKADSTVPTIPSANVSFRAHNAPSDPSSVVTSGLDSDNKVINLVSFNTNIPPINFTVNDTATGSGINFTSIAVILDLGTSSQQYLMWNGTLNTNTLEQNTRNGSIRLMPGVNGSLGLLTAGGTTAGTSHTLTVSVKDNSTNAATNYSKTFYVNRIILGANRTSNIVANGSDRINLTAHLIDPDGRTSLTAGTVSWSDASGGSTFSSSLTNSTGGNATTTIVFSTAGVHTIQAQANGTTNTIQITTTATVAGVSLTASKSSIVANGTDTATLRAQALDASGNAVLKSGYTVQLLESTSAYSGVSPLSGTTDSNGMFNSTVTANTTTGVSLSFTATINLDNGTQSTSSAVPISFTSGPVMTLGVNTSVNGSSNASNSFVGLNRVSPGQNASIDSLVAGNTTIISVNLTDDGTHPISSATVSFALSGAGSLSATSATTNSTGTAAVTFTSGTTAGNLTSIINITTSSNATLYTYVRVNTTNGTANKVALNANRTGLATSSVTNITATIQDANGNQVNISGVNVTWSIITGSSLGNLSKTFLLTNSTGQSVVDFTAGTTVGTVVVQANVTNLNLPGSPGNLSNITLTIGTPDGLTLTLNRTNMPTTANGTVTAAAQLTSGGSPIGSPNVNITFLITNGTIFQSDGSDGLNSSNNGTTITVKTNSTGIAQVQVNGSGRVETVTLTASDVDNPAISTQVATITFTGSPTTFTLTNGTISSSAGVSSTVVTVQLKDSAGNNVGSANGVTFVNGSGGTLSASSGTTNASTGQLNVTLSANTASSAASPTVTAYISGMTPTSQTLTVNMPQSAAGTPLLVSSITPTSRNAQVGTPVTIFMSVINGGTATATGVSIAQASSLPVTVSYQQWDGTTFIGSPNTPVDIAASGTANFVLTINATSAFNSSSLTFNVSGTNVAAASISGVNTLTISASATPLPDVIMISTTLNVSTAVNTATSFAVATSNVGANATGVSLNVVVPTSITGLAYQVNQTNPTTGAIIGPATGLTINTGEQPTFAVFLQPTQAIALDLVNNRITLQLVDGTGRIIGAQSVAISTQ